LPQRQPKEKERRKEAKLNVVSPPSLDLCLPHRQPKKKEGSTIHPIQQVSYRASRRAVTPHSSHSNTASLFSTLISPQQIYHRKERERTTNQQIPERSRSEEGEEKNRSVKKES